MVPERVAEYNSFTQTLCSISTSIALSKGAYPPRLSNNASEIANMIVNSPQQHSTHHIRLQSHVTFTQRCLVTTTCIYRATISHNANGSPRRPTTHHIHTHLAPEPLVPSFNLTHPFWNPATIIIQTSCPCSIDTNDLTTHPHLRSTILLARACSPVGQ
jgi:hypothetical protein